MRWLALRLPWAILCRPASNCMRSSVSFVAALFSVLGACAPTPPITVVHLSRNAERGDGDRVPVRVRRPPADTYAGLPSGAFVVRDADDWRKMWKGVADPPAYPKSVDPDMLVVVANRDQLVSTLEVTRVLESAGLVNVWVRQTMIGEGCARRADDPPSLDAVVTPRIDKPFKFYIEDEDGPSCGEPPKAQIACRLAKADSWASKMTAKPGDVIECELSSVARGRYELVDQTLTLTDLPPGSNAKLEFGSSGATRATLALDTHGTYAVRGEATDEAGRRGRATALIEVLPKKTRDVLLQLSWSDVDTDDPNAPSPRVLLRVTQEGPRGQRCSSEVPVPGLCDAKTRGDYTYMRIPASRRKLPLSLLYLDERPQVGPSPCVSVWFNGERTTSLCDRDHRHAEDRWELGTLDTTNGKVSPPKPPREPKPPVVKPAPLASSSAAANPARWLSASAQPEAPKK